MPKRPVLRKLRQEDCTVQGQLGPHSETLSQTSEKEGWRCGSVGKTISEACTRFWVGSPVPHKASGPVILALGDRREDQMFKVILVYILNLRASWATLRPPPQKKTPKLWG